MVLMAMTPALADAVRLYVEHATVEEEQKGSSLRHASKGNPISHAQIIQIAKWLSSEHGVSQEAVRDVPKRLNDLLKGCQVYHEPKAEPTKQTSEYKQLMSRLRKEEEAKSYERMVNPQTSSETFSQRFPNSRYNTIFPVQSSKADQDEDITFAEVKRQATLIINVLVSIICTAVFLWIAARRWSVEARLGLSMIGALVVAIAEVVIFGGYLRRLKEAKHVERKKVEVKTVEKTWIIEGKPKFASNGVRLRLSGIKSEDPVR